MSLLKKESAKNEIRVSQLMTERDKLKAELLIRDQMSTNHKMHDEEDITKYEIEISRLMETVEKKEYTL